MENFQDDKNSDLTCKDEGVKRIVLQVLESSDNRFPFERLFMSIKNKILEFENSYPRRELTEVEIDIINKTIWDQIWDRKLMIDFTDKRLYRNSEIFHFIKIKSLETK